MRESVEALLIFFALITAPVWIVILLSSLYMAGSALYFMPVWFGFWIYGIYIAVFLIILTLYILGKRRKTEVREIDLYTPSFVLKKGGR